MIKTFLMFALLYSAQANAATCIKDYAGSASCVENENTAGDCETLGYSINDVDGCTNYLYCPFNTAYKKCVAGCQEIDCEELGYTRSSKDGWCSNQIECPTDNRYTACVESPYDYCEDIGFTYDDKYEWCSEVVHCPEDEDLTLCAAVCNYELTSCPSYGICDTCTSYGTTKYKLTGCDDTHCMKNSSCSNSVCGDQYHFGDAIYGYGGVVGKGSGSSCYGYKKGYDGYCVESTKEYFYTDITCNYGYEKKDGACWTTSYMCEENYYDCRQEYNERYECDYAMYFSECESAEGECKNEFDRCITYTYCYYERSDIEYCKW